MTVNNASTGEVLLSDNLLKKRIDIEFENLKYTVKDVNSKDGNRQILNSINGKFCSGELTAILGVSGAGKTSLLNVLAGYITSGVEGVIKINNAPRDLKTFNKISSYIMQDNIVQPFLTVKESLLYAAGFKLGTQATYKEKTAIIEEVISFLGLEDCVNTRSEYLSGGERKRLSVALELVNNPPVIFLDEPTTGLDYFAAKQCIDLLKNISNLGRTVICTIHQPPTSLLKLFDQVYIVADGFCIYNGSISEAVPFLSLAGYTCPPNDTPVDYLIELVHLYPLTVDDFQALIQNGKINMKESEDNRNLEVDLIQKTDGIYSTTFRFQFMLLLSRMFLQKSRNKTSFYILTLHHIFTSSLIAAIFGRIGNNAAHTIPLFKFLICCLTFFLFTYLLIPVLSFPFECKFLKMEHFNRWYRLEAYYLALTVANLPRVIFYGAIYSTITYFFTDQPLEVDRIVGFFLVNYMLAITSESFGYIIGSLLDVMKGSIVGAATLGSLLMLSAHGVDLRFEIVPFFAVLLEMTYARNGLVGLANVLFYKRGPLACEGEFCYFTRPDELMTVSSVKPAHYSYHVGRLLIFYVTFKILCYVALKCRLNNDIYGRFVYYAKRIESVRNIKICSR